MLAVGRSLAGFQHCAALIGQTVCFMGGPLVNKLGVKWALVLGSMSFPIQGSAYYCNSKFGTQWVSGYRSGVPAGGRGLITWLLVSHSQRCDQRHWDRVLVCCRGRGDYDACAYRRSREVSGVVDCGAESRAVGWGGD